MDSRWLAPCALAALMLAACDPGLVEVRGDTRLTDDVGISLPLEQSRTIYLHRQGGVYTASAFNDSRSNEATVLDEGAVVELPAYGGSDAQWEQAVACVREELAPFDVDLRLREPEADEIYIEVVVGGAPGDAGFPRQTLGIGPRRLDCLPIERGIALVFSEAFGEQPEGVCWGIIHELGHVLGLLHVEGDCDEAMSYEVPCSRKQFRDLALSCDPDPSLPSDEQCSCGTEQNSYQHMLRVLGPSR